MPHFGMQSETNLSGVHPLLVFLLRRAIRSVDFKVICGHRNEEQQTASYEDGRSTKRWPESKHNQQPSLAVDIIPYPFESAKDWRDTGRFYMLIGFIKCMALLHDIKIRVGADWDMDGRTQDQMFHDLPHIELVEEYIDEAMERLGLAA